MKAVNFADLCEIPSTKKIDKIFTTEGHGDHLCYHIVFTHHDEQFVIENIDMNRLNLLEGFKMIEAIEGLDVALWNRSHECWLDPTYLCHRYKTYSGFVSLMGTTAFITKQLASILVEEDQIEPGEVWPLWSTAEGGNLGAKHALRVLSPEHESAKMDRTKFTISEKSLAHLGEDQKRWLADQITEGRVMVEAIDEWDLLDY